MPEQRYKITKLPEGPSWSVQGYGLNYEYRFSFWELAIWAITSGEITKYAPSATHSTLRQDEERCPDCGRRTEYEETTWPGGGGSFSIECTHCDYRYSDSF